MNWILIGQCWGHYLFLTDISFLTDTSFLTDIPFMTDISFLTDIILKMVYIGPTMSGMPLGIILDRFLDITLVVISKREVCC